MQNMLKPLNDHVVVKAVPENEKTASGILLPEINKEKPEKGEVIAVGPGKLFDNGMRAPMGVQPGQKVIFTKYSPNSVKIDDQEYLILSESDILAIID
jgi:chaperonin GroES